MRAARVLAGTVLVACGDSTGGDGSDSSAAVTLPRDMLPPPLTNADGAPPSVPFDVATPRIIAVPVTRWPHDTGAYTQGLVVDGARVLESTGLVGFSTVRELQRGTGRIVRRVALPDPLFGEGIAVIGARIHQLTWRGGRGYARDAATFAVVDSFRYDGEGWGLATDGSMLYLSDGSSRIRVVDPARFDAVRAFTVTEAGRPVPMLNELEWVRGELWANIYQTDLIARIDPASGRIVGWVDLARLLTPEERRDVAARGGTANGIAYDAARDRILVTGKRWPHVFELDARVLTRRDSSPAAAR